MKKCLQYPKTSKKAYIFDDGKLKGGAVMMQGYRVTMEDCHSVVQPLPNHPDVSMFAIFDGHGGTEAAKWCQANLYRFIDNIDGPLTEKRLSDAIMAADSAFGRESGRTCGTTACVALINTSGTLPWDVTIANVGDSRCLIGCLGEEGVELTKDHKPTLPNEKTRIQNVGGFVLRRRVEGRLAMSGSIGDTLLKDHPSLSHVKSKQKVIAAPEFTHTKLHGKDFLLLCCDGLLEAMDSKDLIDHISYEFEDLGERADPVDILARLIDECLSIGSQDNMSAVLVYPSIDPPGREVHYEYDEDTVDIDLEDEIP